MAVITANVTTANWNVNSTWVGSVQPTAADDVIIPASAVITIPTATTVLARSLTVSASGTLAFASTTAVLNIGDGTAGAGNVAISISSTATITLTGIGTIGLISTSATQQTITSAGKTLPIMTMSTASNYILGDALTTSGTFNFNLGTFDTGSFAFTPSVFASAAGTKTLTLGTGTAITCNNWNLRTSGTTVTANTATITQSGSASNFDVNSLSGLNYNGTSLVQSGAATALIGQVSTSLITLANYTRTGTATKTDGLTLGCNLTTTGTMTINGNSSINRMWVISDITGTARTLTAATVSVSNLDMMDITGAGAGSWNIAACTGNSGDCQGNSGITFTTPATQTFTSGTKNYSDVTVWTSRVPLPQDDVIINTTTATTLTLDMPRMGRNINFTTFNKTFTVTSLSASIFGNLTLSPGMTWTWGNTTTLSMRGRGSQTITSAGQSYGGGGNYGLFIIAPGGTYTLQDAIATYSLASTGQIGLQAGTFNTNNFSVTTGSVSVTGTVTRTLTLGSSTVSLGGVGTIWNATTTTGLTLTSTGSTIVSTVVSATGRTIIGGGLKYGALTYTVAGSTGSLTLIGSNYFSAINFTDSTNARSLLLTSGTMTTVGTLSATGASGRLISINAVTSGTAAFLDILDAPPTLDWLSVKDIFAGIPYKFYAGTNSTNVSGNTNVTFTAKPSPDGVFVSRYATNTSASTSITATFPYSLTPTVGDALVAFWEHSGNAGTVTPPTGWTAIDAINASTTTYLKAYYKISDGTETAFTFTSTSSPASTMLYVYSLDGFLGTATLDNTDKNSGTAITSLVTSGTPSSNTGNPAYAIAGFAASNTMGVTVSMTNSFLEGRGVTQQTMLRPVMKPLTTNAAVSTTYTWTTSRDATTILVVFKDVVAAGSSIKSLSALGVG